MEDIKSIKEDLAILLERTKGISELTSSVNDINIRLQKLELKFGDEMRRFDKSVEELLESQDFISKEFEKQKTVMNNITNKNTLVDKENKTLKGQLTSLQHQLEEEKASRNVDTQYLRSSLNIKIVGVPFQIGEDIKSEPNNQATLAIVLKIAEVAHINHFSYNHIDVCHRVGTDKYSPIIVRFKEKAGRMKFFNQRKNLWNINTKDFGFYGQNEEKKAVDRRRNKDYTPYVQLQESLTNYNAELLRLAREKTEGLNYEFNGYVSNGQIRVKKKEKDKFIAIRCKSDIDKII